ncbi:MAG: hypothetical protein WCI27_11645, partial [Candidatus Omnitrophota bacterium]
MTSVFVKKILLLLFPLMVIIGAVNYGVDPASLFHSGEEARMARVLLEGGQVRIGSNFDERIFQRNFILNLKDPRDTVILGSSRSLGVDRTIVPSGSLFNSSVSGASLEDFLAVYGLYRECGKLPKTLILSLDPWLLNKNNGQVRYRSLYLEYARLIKLLDGGGRVPAMNPLYKMAELFSVTYFQNALKVGVRKLIARRGVGEVASGAQETGNSESVKMPDGSMSDTMFTAAQQAGQADEEAVKYASEKDVYSLARFFEMDPRLKNLFERFVARVRQDGVKVVFLFSPYHPLAYEKMAVRLDTRIILDCEKYFRDFAGREDILVIGSYDPRRCGFVNSDFMDGMHL